jgi:formaldehyde-activating enzyme involved in methanogenesis
MIARAALEHRQLPCTSYDEKITGAIQPALASAVLEALSASAA